MKVTNKQWVWLDCRGGRDEGDVKEDKKGLYVLMVDEEGKDKKVYIPPDNRLVIKVVVGHRVAKLI